MAIDDLLVEMQHGLSVLAGVALEQRKMPVASERDAILSLAEKQRSAALMRVNHVGEVCAQALYRGQKAAAAEQHLKSVFHEAACEEVDHLSWTAQRIAQLEGRKSLLNPMWYAASFTLGFFAGKVGGAWSLGFMAETEKQVEQHLDSHLSKLPASDQVSRNIVERMKHDEIKHGAQAWKLGATPLPLGAKWLMKGMAKVMTSTSYYL